MFKLLAIHLALCVGVGAAQQLDSFKKAAPRSSLDILIEDFESSRFFPWKTQGRAFGTEPVSNETRGKKNVTGFMGCQFASSHHDGDAGEGSLTSRSFTVQRDYIQFLIGGGNQRGKTCMNLMIDGRPVRSAVGMGDSGKLTWMQWNVSELKGRTATIQILDTATNAWGFVQVDHIVQSDLSFDAVIMLNKRYLNLPVKTGAPKKRMELVVDGLVVHEFLIELAETETPDFYAFLDLSEV
ncbi:hypothetical protein PDESU_00980 [Pontiella desulfatans]|uniref:Uncharacterized protein n=1 Tax=Pontiella desulfatans TaxID=2750659 RepID=A0A6C2TXJ4_PONDE|nr:hypothetical protein [Pontiella desulfatans]VGO12428.1 hypothetical protein PDESU_00980 [Pontiella desulfatans]